MLIEVGKNHIHIEILQLSNRQLKHLDIVYRIEDMGTQVSYENWHTFRCQLGKRLTFRKDFEPVFPSKFALIRGFSPVGQSSLREAKPRINAPLFSLQKFVHQKLVKKAICPPHAQSGPLSPKSFQNEIINRNNFSIMFFSQIRVVREDLGSAKSDRSDLARSKSFLVSDSLNVYSRELDVSKINDLNQFVSRIQSMHRQPSELEAAEPRQETPRATILPGAQAPEAQNVCEVTLTPDKDIICSQKKKSLEVSVTFFVKGSFKIYIDIFSFPINTFLAGTVFREFCEQFFSEKLIEKFVVQIMRAGGANKHLFHVFAKEPPSQPSMPSQLSLQMTLKSNMRTYTNNSVYRRDTSKRESVVSGNPEKRAKLSSPQKSDFLALLVKHVDKKVVLAFLKRNVAKKDICEFLASNVSRVNLNCLQKSCIVAEASDISQASIEIKEVTSRLEKLEKNVNVKTTNALEKFKMLPKGINARSASQRNDAFNLSQLQTTKHLTFKTERMNFAKKQFLLINNGESKIQFELSLLQSVFQESNLRDETQIDKIETDVRETQKNLGKHPPTASSIFLFEESKWVLIKSV